MQNDTSPPSAASGSWILTSYESTAADGTKKQNLGSTPLGTAQFDGHGNFMIIVMRSDLPVFASGNRERGTAQENEAIIHGSIAYFGTYTVSETGNELVLLIKGATLPNWIGTTQIRTVAMPTPDELHLINPTASSGGSAEIRWRRANAN